MLSLSNQAYTDKFCGQFLSGQSHNILAQRTLNILSSDVTPITTAAKIAVVSHIVPSHSLLHFGMSGLALNYRCDVTSMNTLEIVFFS